MKRAIIFGAGNIGRGFIGQLYCESGYDVTFVDVDDDLVTALNREQSYRLQTVFNDDVNECRIGPVRAVHGSDTAAVEEAVAQAEIGATAVGAGALKFIAPRIAAGAAARARRRKGPLNIIVCENLKGAAAALRGLVREHVARAQAEYFERSMGFVDTVIGRMVPIPTPDMRAEDVSLIRVEPYKELPVDESGFVGGIPDICAMLPQSSFPLFTARKLYVHNCGHALLAYTGYLRGHAYGYQALADPVVRDVLDAGLGESIAGIVAKYDADVTWLEEHARDLMARFANRALGDTIYRLGRDPRRKLSPGDRLVAPAELAVSANCEPRCLAWGIAAACLFDPPDDASAQELQRRIRVAGIATALAETTGLAAESALGRMILDAYATLSADRMAEAAGDGAR